MFPPSGLPMHKNYLQEYAQRSSLQMPCYNTINQGFAHAPNFRSTVLIGDQTYASPRTFTSRKEAEQDAAKLALVSITKNPPPPLIHQLPLSWKSILLEFAMKTNTPFPKYAMATHSDDKRPVFVSRLVFGNNTFTGEVAKSKKNAQQFAAKAAINSILESSSRNIALQIIQSKCKHNVANPPPSVERKRKFEDKNAAETERRMKMLNARQS